MKPKSGLSGLEILDFGLTALITLSHISMTFWVNNSIATWSIKGLVLTETLRYISDLLIIGILLFHLADSLLGKKLWPQVHLNVKVNLSLIGGLFVLSLPYLRLWFLYYYYVGIWIDLIRALCYTGVMIIWAIAIIYGNRMKYA